MGKSKAIKFVAVILLLTFLVNSNYVGSSFVFASESNGKQSSGAGEVRAEETPIQSVEAAASSWLDGEVDLRWARPAYNEIEIKWSAMHVYDEVTGQYIPAPNIDRYSLEWKSGDTWTVLKETTDDFYFLHTGLPEASFSYYRLFVYDKDGNKSEPYPLKTATDHQYTKILFSLDQEGFYDFAISEDGEVLVFLTDAQEMPGAVEGETGLYSYQIADGSIKRIDQAIPPRSDSTESSLAVSGSGRYIVYGKMNQDGQYELCLYDSLTSMITKVATQSRKAENFAISRDGTKVVLDTSFALSTEDTNGVKDVYLYDAALPEASRLKRISVAASGEQGSEESKHGAISADGHYVAFVTTSTELISPDVQESYTNNLYLYDTTNGTLKYIPVEDRADDERYPVDVTWPSLSEDGRYIVYRNFVNARGLRAELLDLSSGQAEQVWETRGNSLISLEVPKLTTNGRFVYLDFYNYDPYSSLEPYTTRGELLFDTTKEKQYRYLGKLLDASHAVLTGDGSHGVYTFWNAPYEEYEGEPSRPEGAQLVYVCLESCQEQEPPQDKITKASLELPNQVNGAAQMGGSVIVRSLAQEGLELAATIEYETVDQAGTRSAIVSLAADPAEPRSYRANWNIPDGAARIVSVRVAQEGNPSEGKDAILVPIEVAGALKVSLETSSPELLQGAKVHLWSSAQQSGNAAVFPDSLEVVSAVKGSADYVARITDASGNLLAEKSGIVVSPGENSELYIPVKPAAELSISVVDEGGKSLNNIRLEIRKPEGELLYSGKTLSWGILDVPNLFSMGDEIEVRVFAHSPYQSPSPVKYTLQAGHQEQQIKLVNLEYAIVTGITALQDKPVPGVTVQALTSFGSVAGQSISDSDGRYQLRVPAGEYSLSADRKAQPLYALPQLVPITLGESETQSHHLALTAQGFGMIVLDVETKGIDGSLTPVAITDWRSAVHYGLKVKTLNASTGVMTNSVNEKGIPVYGTPGDTFEVCASGSEAGLSSSCDTVVLDSKREATATLRFEEAAQLVGSITGPGPEAVQSMQLSWRENSSNKWSAIRFKALSKTGAFMESLPKAGHYKLAFYNHHSIEIYRTELEVSQGQRVNLPPIALTGKTRLFAGQPGNGYSSNEYRASVGDSVTLRAEYLLNDAASVTDTQLVIGVAAGSSLLKDSVILNNAPVEVAEEGGGSYTINLGDVAAGSKGTLSYRVRIDSGALEQSLHQLSIRYRIDGSSEAVEETLGSAYLLVGDVTLEAPKWVKQKSLTVSGRAPAGKEVLVYADMALVGSAQATQGGLWTANVTLPDKSQGLIWEESPIYRLTAKVHTESGYGESRPLLVEVDPSAPAITEMSIEQDGGRKAVFHPELGISRFPFVVVPGQSFFVKLGISNSNRISNPVVSIGRTSVPLIEQSPGQYEAVIPAGREMGSGIFVSYDTAPLTKPISVEAPTAKQWEAQQSQLASNWGEVKDSIADPSTDGPDPQAAYTPTYRVVYPGKEAIEANVRMSVKYEKLTETQDPYLGFEPTWDYETGTLVVKGSIARSAITPQLLQELKTLAPRFDSAPSPELSTDYLGITFSVAFPKAETFNKAFGYFGTLKSYVADTMDFMDYADQLLQFQDYVIQNECYAPNVNYYVKQTENLFDMASTGLLVKNTITGIGLVAGVALSKLPTWATASAAAYMTAINDAVMSKWGSRLDDLKKEFEADKKWRDDMAAAGAIDRCKKKEDDKEEEEPQNKVADPVWIWDPSGYAYEALPSNRLEGVKATLLQEAPDNPGYWSEWDAEWFGQQNPLITDALGKYGWDVPEGRWRVLYTKEGYQPAQSADLEVLPPHFDVNVGMVSLQSPIPTVGQAVAGQALGFVFSKYMLAESVKNAGVIVENARGDQVSGVVEAADEQTDELGQLLARSFRFIPDKVLVEGEVYVMRVLSHVQSYAHVGMEQEMTFDLTVLPSGTKPEEAATDLRLSSGSSQLLAQWTPRITGDGISYKLTAVPIGNSSCQSTEMEVGISRSSASFEGLCPGTSYHLRVATVDGNGNESAGITEPFATKAVKTPLADLTPPAEVSMPRAVWENDQLAIRWTDPIDADFHHVELAYRVKGASAYKESLIVMKGTQHARLLQLDSSNIYEFELRTFDHRLNGSQGISFVHRATDNGGGNGGGDGGSGTGGNGGTGGSGNTNSDTHQAEMKLSTAANEYTLFDHTLTLSWPAGTFKQSAALQAKRQTLGTGMIPAGMKPMGDAYSLQSELPPLKRISLQALADGNLLKEADIRKVGLYRQDDRNPGKWVYIGGVVQKSKLMIRANISEWGTYALFLREVSFSDIENHWSRQEVEVLASRWLLQGTSLDEFEPGRELTRAEAVTLLLTILQAAGKVTGTQDAGGGVSFSDVKSEAWYKESVELAASLGIVSGSQGRFRPDDEMTREEFATILHRAFPSIESSTAAHALDGFQDADSVSDWARPAMQAAVKAGLLKGLLPTILAPRAKLKRGEAAVIMYRLLARMELITE
ncbi:S-layer homology domain-containing protein [Paenibacillus sp. strain BS8-2]